MWALSGFIRAECYNCEKCVKAMLESVYYMKVTVIHDDSYGFRDNKALTWRCVTTTSWYGSVH